MLTPTIIIAASLFPFLLGRPAHAVTTILQPSSLSSLEGSFRPTLIDANDLINQVGLSPNYVSGVTDFSTVDSITHTDSAGS